MNSAAFMDVVVRSIELGRGKALKFFYKNPKLYFNIFDNGSMHAGFMVKCFVRWRKTHNNLRTAVTNYFIDEVPYPFRLNNISLPRFTGIVGIFCHTIP